MNTMNNFSIVEKASFQSFFIIILLLNSVFTENVHAQENASITEMPVRDKYAFIAWQMEKKGSLRYEMVNSEEFIDFSAMLLRDVFSEGHNELASLVKNNNNEFGKKMFTDSILSLVQKLKPIPFGKYYSVACEATLSEYDFNAKRFRVFLDTDKKFLSRDNQLFREQISLLKDKYKSADNIPIPFFFTNSSIPSYGDKFSIWSKGWNYLNYPPEGAQKILEKIISYNPDQKRRLYARITYSPVEYDNREIATNVLGISYYADSGLTDLIFSYPDSKSSESTVTVSKIEKSESNPRFADLPYLRKLNPENDNVRFVVYKGVIESGIALLNGKECYHSKLFMNYTEKGSNKYEQVEIGTDDRNNLTENLDAAWWIQVGPVNTSLWVEGYFNSYQLESKKYGKYGRKVGAGSKILVQAPKFMEELEFSDIPNDKEDRFMINRLLKIYDKKGNEVATCKLNPVSGDLSAEAISEHLMFKGK